MYNQSLLADLTKLALNMVGVEMEAGGVGAATHQAETNFFMVRGASDLANGDKDAATVREWRAYACDVAAAYLVGLLQSGLLPAPDRRPRTVGELTPAEIVQSTSAAVNRIDQVARVLGLEGELQQGQPTHRMTIERSGIELVGRWNGQVTQTITGEDLLRLPPALLRHVRVYEKSMENLYAIWEQVYPELALLSDPVQKAQVKQRLTGIIRQMKADLLAVLEALEQSGLHLDDHYHQVRHLVSTL